MNDFTIIYIMYNDEVFVGHNFLMQVRGSYFLEQVSWYLCI